MNRKPCKQCGADSVVIHDDYLHLCSPCWIEKFVVKGGNNDRQSDRKVSRSDRKALQSSASQPNGLASAY